jgi:TRAP-type mannitol/chloroaromatic compound transport system permease small subunit
MDVWLRVAERIDRFNERAGRIIYWCTFAMVLVGAFNTIIRYVDRFTGWGISSNFYIELQWYLFSLVFLLGAAYTLKHDAHVRADVLYSYLSEKSRAWIDLIGTVVFLIPFCLFILWVNWPAVRRSWEILESSPDPGGLPRYPIKTVVLIAFVLLITQAVSMAIKKIGVIRGVVATDEVDVDPQMEGI